MKLGDLDELKKQLELHLCFLEHDEPYTHERVIECRHCIEQINKAETIETEADNLIKQAEQKGYENGYRNGNGDGYRTGYEMAKKESKRPHGEWIKGREISRTMIGDKVQHIEYKDYTCSNCGLVLDNLLYHVDGSPFYKFCPNCGADMRGGSQ